MADGSVTVTGLAELRRAVDTFDQTLTLQLRAIAFRTSREVKEIARQNLLAQIRGHNTEGHQHTADSIVIHEEDEKKQFVVTVENPDNPMLGTWLERGTVHMSARPFMRPAGDAVEPSYVREMTEAATAAGDALGQF